MSANFIVISQACYTLQNDLLFSAIIIIYPWKKTTS